MNQFISLLLAIVQIGKFCEADTHLFDLNIHPHEEDIYESLSSEYSDVYDTLVERSSYWSNYVISTVDVDGTNKKSTWKKNGGVTSWITNEDFTPVEIIQKYNYTDAPNIVFVLVDDWVSCHSLCK